MTTDNISVVINNIGVAWLSDIIGVVIDNISVVVYNIGVVWVSDNIGVVIDNIGVASLYVHL